MERREREEKRKNVLESEKVKNRNGRGEKDSREYHEKVGSGSKNRGNKMYKSK